MPFVSKCPECGGQLEVTSFLASDIRGVYVQPDGFDITDARHMDTSDVDVACTCCNFQGVLEHSGTGTGNRCLRYSRAEGTAMKRIECKSFLTMRWYSEVYTVTPAVLRTWPNRRCSICGLSFHLQDIVSVMHTDERGNVLAHSECLKLQLEV